MSKRVEITLKAEGEKSRVVYGEVLTSKELNGERALTAKQYVAKVAKFLGAEVITWRFVGPDPARVAQAENRIYRASPDYEVGVPLIEQEVMLEEVEIKEQDNA